MNSKDEPSDFFFHLEELRRCLLVCLALIFTASVAAFFFSHPLLEYFARPIRAYSETSLYFLKPHEAFTARIKISILTGTLAVSPLCFYQIWLFTAPGLYPLERRLIAWLALASSGLFLVGVFFAFAAVVPWSLRFLLSFQTESMKPLIGLEPYFSFLISTLLSFGVLFDFPILIIGLTRLGILRSETIAKWRKLIIVLIFIVAAVLTPSPDPISQVLLALPLWVLFEVSLWISKKTARAHPPAVPKD